MGLIHACTLYVLYLFSSTGFSLKDGPAHLVIPGLQCSGKGGGVGLVPDGQVEGGVGQQSVRAQSVPRLDGHM